MIQSVDIILPGLPALSSRSATLPATLARMLARADCINRPSLTFAHGALRYLHDFAELPSTVCWCCDPVSLTADATQAYVSALPLEAITAAEAEQLVGALQQHVAPLGWRLRIAAANRWYLLGGPALPSGALSPHSLAQVNGANLQWLLRQTAGAGLNALLTEMQMLLHQHTVNEKREAVGMPPVNGVWLHGAGELPHRSTCRWDCIATDDAALRGLAKWWEIDCLPLHSLSVDVLQGYARVLLQTDFLPVRPQQHEGALPRQLRQFESDIAEPLWRLLKRGRLRRLSIDDGDNMHYELRRGHCYRFWRRG